jgi:hypothetical protein
VHRVSGAGGAGGWAGEVRAATAGDAAAVAGLAATPPLSFAFDGDAFRASYPALLADEGACLLLAVAGQGPAGYLLGFTRLTFYANGPSAGWRRSPCAAPTAAGASAGR